MTAQRRSTPTEPPRLRRPGRVSPRGKHVIDLTVVQPPEERMADYEQAFGLPSPLHHHGLPVVVRARRFRRLRALLHVRPRP